MEFKAALWTQGLGVLSRKVLRNLSGHSSSPLSPGNIPSPWPCPPTVSFSWKWFFWTLFKFLQLSFQPFFLSSSIDKTNISLWEMFDSRAAVLILSRSRAQRPGSALQPGFLGMKSVPATSK